MMEGHGLNGGLFLNALNFLPQGLSMEIVTKTICFNKVWNSVIKKFAVTASAENRSSANPQSVAAGYGPTSNYCVTHL
jgi:hypothetical protein